MEKNEEKVMSIEEQQEYIKKVMESGGKELVGIEAEMYKRMMNCRINLDRQGQQLTQLDNQRAELMQAIQVGRGQLDAFVGTLLFAENARKNQKGNLELVIPMEKKSKK